MIPVSTSPGAGKFQLEITTEEASATFHLAGVLDEDSDLSRISKFVEQHGKELRILRFDLGQISGINSCGIRDWMAMLGGVGFVEHFEILDVSEIFISQINMIHTLLGKRPARILSFRAPYVCRTCKKYFQISLQPSQLEWRDGTPHAPSRSCAVCKSEMAFDQNENYFEFMRGQDT